MNLAHVFIVCVMHCCTQVLAPDKVWDKQDQQALQSTQQHCRDEGKCLIKLKKVEQGIYTAICGKDNNE